MEGNDGVLPISGAILKSIYDILQYGDIYLPVLLIQNNASKTAFENNSRLEQILHYSDLDINKRQAGTEAPACLVVIRINEIH